MKQLLFTIALAAGCLSASAQSMKMVVDAKGEVVGRFESETSTSFIVAVQDSYPVPKSGLHVTTFRAERGQGVVYRNQERKGNINVRKGPSLKHAVVAKIPEFDGVPDCYPCLGKVNGWYKIRINGKVGYVREDMACWDGMNSF